MAWLNKADSSGSNAWESSSESTNNLPWISGDSNEHKPWENNSEGDSTNPWISKAVTHFTPKWVSTAQYNPDSPWLSKAEFSIFVNLNFPYLENFGKIKVDIFLIFSQNHNCKIIQTTHFLQFGENYL